MSHFHVKNDDNHNHGKIIINDSWEHKNINIISLHDWSFLIAFAKPIHAWSELKMHTKDWQNM